MTIFRDVRLACRVLIRNPTFTAAALAVLGLGIGATTAAFSVVRSVLLTPLPYREANRVVLFRVDLPGYAKQPVLTGEEYDALRVRADLFESVATIYESEGSLTSPDDMRAVRAASISDGFFETLGVAPALGRAISRRDRGRSSMTSVDISHDVWQKDFHGDPSIVGRSIEVNNVAVTVAGVLPRGFRLHLGAGVGVATDTELWYPDGGGAGMETYRGQTVIARLRRGVSTAAAQAAVDALMARFTAEHPGSYRAGSARLSLTPIDEDVVSQVRPAIIALAGAVAFVLIVACANVMNLLLARATARSHELAVRRSIGASRAQIVEQLLTEGIVIGALAGGIGLLLAQWGVDGLKYLAPASLPQRESIAIDRVVAAVAFATGLATAVLVSLVPAWHATKTDVTSVLRQHAAVPRGASTLRGLLVASQLALALILLVGAGLMMRAFVSLRSMPLGFEPHGAITMRVHLQLRNFDSARRLQFYRQLQINAERLPGVQQVGIGLPVPMAGDPLIQRYAVGPHLPERMAEAVMAFPRYLETLGVHLIAGRAFGPGDDARPLVVVDERLANEVWPGQSAVGRRLVLSPSRDAQAVEVIGVATHVAMRDRRGSGLPQIWKSYGTEPFADMNIVVRGAHPTALVDAVTQAVYDLHPGRPVHEIRLLDDYVDAATADTRFALFVLGVFAWIAVALTAIGVYGVVAYTTARRTREIAVRLALGANASRIVGLVLREGAVWTIAGVAGGLIGARLLTRYLETLLFHVGPTDVATFSAVAALLTTVALVASALPAIRAVRVEPMLSLRAE